jgi:biotin-(acetyl-CoA carboxylase) ligase
MQKLLVIATISTAINLSSLDFELDKYNFVLSFLDHFQMMFLLSSEEIIEKYLVFDCLVGNEITWEGGTGVVKSIGIDGSLIVEMSGETVTLYSEEVHIEKY